MVSDENLRNLKNNQSYLYITALDKNQIAGVEKINLERFKDLTNEITEKEILSKEVKKSLLNAKKSRNLKPTEQRISEILKKLGVQSFIDPKLESINISSPCPEAAPHRRDFERR